MNNLLSHLTHIDFSNSSDFTDKDLEDRAMLMGVVAEIILSRKLHNKNENLREFINSNFQIELGDYLYKSRTLLLSRIIRLIESSDKEKLQHINKNINRFLVDFDKANNRKGTDEMANKKVRRNSTLDSIDNWAKVIRGE